MSDAVRSIRTVTITERTPALVCFGGLPATGKSTVAGRVAVALAAAYVRIDTIETAVARAEGDHAATNDWELPPGYAVGYDMAREQLRLGLDVVAESVNPLEETRQAWRQAADDAGAATFDVEVVCSDPAEHRRRAEGRTVDVPGLILPTWDQILEREYEPWDRDRLVIDTSAASPADAAQAVLAGLSDARSGGGSH